MAAAPATMRYASRAAVNGSNAYDLNRIKADSYRTGASSASAQPKKSATVGYATLPRSVYAPTAGQTAPKAAASSRTAAATVKSPEMRTTRQTEENSLRKPVQRTAPKAAQKAQKAYGISLFAVAGFALVTVMMVFVLLAYVKYSEITNDTVQLQARLDTLTAEERKLKIAYEDAFDVNEVASYATNVLGMTKMTDTQVATVDTGAADKAEVVGTPSDNTVGQSGITTFLMSLVAYFK